MSIAAGARTAFATEAKATDPTFRTASATPSVPSAIESVTRWIPTEAVGTYVAILGLILPKQSGGRWAVFAGGVVLVVAFTAINVALINRRGADEWQKEQKQGDPPKLAGKRAAALLVISTLCFVIWACALPATPFLDLTSQATRIGGAAALIVAPFLPKIAELLKLQPPNA